MSVPLLSKFCSVMAAGLAHDRRHVVDGFGEVLQRHVDGGGVDGDAEGHAA
jgi:hypothetical protein